MHLRVILAEDHAMVRQGLATLLAAAPDIEVVHQAADGEAAWRSIWELKPDIAILDQAMPKATGIEVVQRVQSERLDTRCLLLTMHDEPLLALQAQQAGAAGFILKDNSFEELIRAVGEIAAGRTFVTQSIQAQLRHLRRNPRYTLDFSSREKEVARLLANGKSSKEIGRALAISPRTVDTYRRRMMEKLDAHSVAEVVRYAAQSGMLV